MKKPVTASLEADAAQLHAALSELVRVYQFRDRKSICYYDISVTQCYALQAILRHGGPTLNEVAADLYLDKSTASRVVDSLERKEYVTRVRDPEDGRAVRIAATPAGRKLHARIEKDLVQEQVELLEDFPPDVRKGAARLLARLTKAATERFAAPGCRMDKKS
jgi:MarR family 2-MHQ and catechol resistance regulon transcriptional repressor